ncbi:amidohydrolase family protein [Sporosarcina gallistercoris]|uniref:Amidohydrolase family protein n=1 Tax=Sporosarcina gallistercoris TaxID=2762245 RepID=A0ABR8PJ57_9BACL|nr:amidohydrolase family protein [Sporosarcina gallistercoris]MBD7908109.1 amidohydrolase family protein [Sporosarcina gallistercoris]
MKTLLIRNARIRDDQDLQDIWMEEGVIRKIGSGLSAGADREIDCKGRVVLPGLVEGHIHPDKAFLEERKPNVSGTLEEAIKNTGELKAEYTYEDVYARSEKVLKWAIAKGTTVMRAHPDVDHIEKLMGVEVLLELKEVYKDKIDLQIVVFPQEGILKSEGTLERMEEGILMGADVVGGCPYNEKTLEDSIRHLELVFDLAKKHELPLDLHVDFADHTEDPRYLLTDRICDLTIERGMQGRVTLGHVTTLGSLDLEEASLLFAKIAHAGITIMPLPATDVYLNGRNDEKNVRRGMAPVRQMLEHGVNVAFASNNIRNAFTPFGNANLLLIGYLLAETQFMGSAEQQRAVLDMITYNAAKCLGIEETYGIAEGKKADLVVFDSLKLSDVIQDQPIANYVIKAGRVIVEQSMNRTVE